MKEDKIAIEHLETDLINSITSDHLIQIGVDTGEIILDTIINEGIIKNIPIFGTIYKSVKVGIGIHEQFFAKKILKFLVEIKNIPQYERQKFIKELDEVGQRSGQKAGETLLILLERLDNLEKPALLSQLLKAQVAEQIDIIQFLRLSTIVEKAFLPDLKRLKEYKVESDHKLYVTESLLSLGLIYMSNTDGGTNILYESVEIEEVKKYSLTETGKDLLQNVVLD